jgi:hypothetical protein
LPVGGNAESIKEQAMRRIKAIAAAGAAATTLALMVLPVAAAADNDFSQSQIQRGFEINPVPLNLKGKNRALVGLGSYIVNSGGCSDCHTNPSYASGGNPFLGEPEQVNTAGFLAGGQHFGPFTTSANITPDALGRPAGLTLEQFISTLRTGHNPLDPPGTLLQVMPWPAFGKKTDRDLTAIYEYLRSIPSIETAQ